jgi:hypothetical protein
MSAIVAWKRPFDPKRLHDIREQEIGNKPDGVWYAIGSEWIDWCEAENFSCGDYRYTLDLDYSRILRLQTEEAILDFGRKFGVVKRGFRSVDWPRVTNIYAGIEIAPYQWTLRSDRRVEWYYGWDIASGCVWDVSAILAVHELREESRAEEEASKRRRTHLPVSRSRTRLDRRGHDG